MGDPVPDRDDMEHANSQAMMADNGHMNYYDSSNHRQSAIKTIDQSSLSGLNLIESQIPAEERALNEQLYDPLITKRVEMQKLKQIKMASDQMKRHMSKIGRCEICTLLLPCKHSSSEYKASRSKPREEAIGYHTYQLHTSRVQNSQGTDTQVVPKESARSNVHHTHLNQASIDISRYSKPNDSVNIQRSHMDSQNDDLLDMDYQYKQYNAEHFEKMAEVQAGSPYLHSKVSPYSILRLSAQEDVDGTI